MSKHTAEQIQSFIKNSIPKLTEEELVHNYQCASSRGDRVYIQLLTAIEKELRLRRKEPAEEPLTDV